MQAKWANEGLQTDTLSVENGAILNSAARWPLFIDPQLQGWRWITQKEGPNGLVILQQSQSKYLDKVHINHMRLPCFACRVHNSSALTQCWHCYASI